MQLQYLASQSSQYSPIAAFRPQICVFSACGHLLATLSCHFAHWFASARQITRQALTGASTSGRSVQRDRRSGCPRASSFLHGQAFWPVLQPAHSRRKTCMLWSTRNPFRSNRSLTASTSNLVAGWLGGPTPQTPHSSVSGGLTC